MVGWHHRRRGPLALSVEKTLGRSAHCACQSVARSKRSHVFPNVPPNAPANNRASRSDDVMVSSPTIALGPLHRPRMAGRMTGWQSRLFIARSAARVRAPRVVRAIPQRLREPQYAHALLTGEIGDRPRHAQCAVHGAHSCRRGLMPGLSCRDGSLGTGPLADREPTYRVEMSAEIAARCRDATTSGSCGGRGGCHILQNASILREGRGSTGPFAAGICSAPAL